MTYDMVIDLNKFQLKLVCAEMLVNFVQGDRSRGGGDAQVVREEREGKV